MEPRKEREMLYAVYEDARERAMYSIDNGNADAAKVYVAAMKAKIKLQEFDLAHPEVAAALRAEKAVEHR